MRVLLVNPSIPEFFYNEEFYLPSGLLYLGAVLRDHGDDVHVLDMKTFRPEPGSDFNAFYGQALQETLDAFEPELIGFGCLFSGCFPQVLELARLCKRSRPQVPIMAGGIHVTIHAQAILTHCPEIDYLCLGEAEESVVQLVHALKYHEIPACIDGLAYRIGDQVVVHPKQSYIEDVDQIPFPAYELIDISQYAVDTSQWYNPRNLTFDTSIPIISSRSCPHRCTFCSVHMVNGPRWRGRSATNVVDEIEYVYHTYGQSHFSFMDDNCTLDRKRTLEMCRQIGERRLRIQFETPNGLSIRTLDEEVLDALVEAGLVRVSLAIESGSEFIRNKIMRKNLAQDKIYEVVRLTKKYPQLYVKAFFIMGLPEESHETLEQTRRMIEEIDIDRVYLQNMIPYPGTPIFEQAQRDHLLLGIDTAQLYRDPGMYMTNWDRFYIKPYQLSIEDLYAFRKRCEPLLNRATRLQRPPIAIQEKVTRRPQGDEVAPRSQE